MSPFQTAYPKKLNVPTVKRSMLGSNVEITYRG